MPSAFVGVLLCALVYALACALPVPVRFDKYSLLPAVWAGCRQGVCACCVCPVCACCLQDIGRRFNSQLATPASFNPFWVGSGYPTIGKGLLLA